MTNITKIPVLLFLSTLAIYALSTRGEGAQWNHFIFLADAFLKGQLYINNNLTEGVQWGNHLFVVYPPMPAIMLMPFVFIFGNSFYQPILSIFLGAVNVLLCYAVLLKLFKDIKIALWISILYAFGTIQWYHAEVGSSWYVAHIVALFFLWLALLESVGRKRLLLIGLFISGAYLARLPTILAVVFVFSYLHEKLFPYKERRIVFNIRNICIFIGGLIIGVSLNALYNYLRFGTVFDVGYTLLPIFNEPWYRYGLFNIRYIPTHLIEVFTSLPKFSPNPPFVIPSIYIMALWFVTPAFLLIALAKFKTQLVKASLITVILMSLPGLMHGNNGSTQFGFRFALDYMPFLLFLTASGLQNYLKWWAILLIILSIIVNLWGIIMITFLNIWVI